MLDDPLDFLRREWLSFLKWTAGISSFLIISLLMILTLNASLEISQCIDKTTLFKLAIFILFHIFFTWGLHAYSLYIYYPKFFTKTQKYPKLSKSLVIVFEGINTIIFLVGFFLFARFVLIYLNL